MKKTAIFLCLVFFLFSLSWGKNFPTSTMVKVSFKFYVRNDSWLLGNEREKLQTMGLGALNYFVLKEQFLRPSESFWASNGMAFAWQFKNGFSSKKGFSLESLFWNLVGAYAGFVITKN
ncbi:MAG: hypothetical protein ACOZAL_00635 [Patescibacteria group bacterium]